MSDNLIRPAFETKRTEEEREGDTDKVFTVRFNPEDQNRLNELKTRWALESDNQTVRNAVHLALNVIRYQFSEGLDTKLFKKKRG